RRPVRDIAKACRLRVSGKHGSLTYRCQISRLARFLQFLARAAIYGRHARNQLLVVVAVPWLVDVKLVEKLGLSEEWQDKDTPAQQRFILLVDRGRASRTSPVRNSREIAEGVVVLVQRQAKLLQVVRAFV